MRILRRERVPQPTQTVQVGSTWVEAEEYPRYAIRGDVFMSLQSGGVETDRREIRNLIVLDASILLARLAKDNAEPPKGIYALAVGTGDTGWDLQAPPAATNTKRSLYSELARKTFATTQFIDAGGLPVAYPTKVVDFTCTFTEGEAVGAICEMGLLGGNISTNMAVQNPVTPPDGPYDATVDLTTKETMFNALHFPVINKPATSTFSITWRLTF